MYRRLVLCNEQLLIDLPLLKRSTLIVILYSTPPLSQWSGRVYYSNNTSMEISLVKFALVKLKESTVLHVCMTTICDAHVI